MNRQTSQTTGVDFKPSPIEPKSRFSLPTIFQIILGIVVVCVVIVGWFLFTAKSVRFAANTESFAVDVSGGFVITSGPSLLMRSGTYQVSAQAPGYENLEQDVVISDASTQQIELKFIPLPGLITLDSNPQNATIFKDGLEIGQTPLELEIAEGRHQLTFSAARYLDSELEIDVAGKHQRQSFQTQLDPDWAEVTLPTSPSAVPVSIDGEVTRFTTPGPIEVLSGEHILSVKLPGYERWSDIVYVTAGETVYLDKVDLVQIGGTVSISSNPSGASVTMQGEFIGTTPFEIDLPSNQPIKLNYLLTGYHEATRTVTLTPGQQQNSHVELQPVTGVLSVVTQPPNATIYLDGKIVGESDQEFSLPVREYELELQRDGFAGYRKNVKIQADFEQLVKVRLLTHEEARLEALKRVRTTPDGQEIVLLTPTTIRMGASRRQPGRRANEAFRTAELSRLFYLGVHEVSNSHFRQFAAGHESGEYQGNTLDKDEQPVVNVSWREAALYLNWLSTQEGLTPFYNVERDGSISVNTTSLGYRFPTEAEWSWVSRTIGKEPDLLLYPWGDHYPPRNRHGNYADRAAQHVVGRIIYNYNDNFIVSAPVGSFDPNDRGIYDLGGNAAEWVHDFYEIPTINSTVDELGPLSGEYHVIRGSSWMHGKITELRLSFRDYGTDGREDVGFRVARYAE